MQNRYTYFMLISFLLSIIFPTITCAATIGETDPMSYAYFAVGVVLIGMLFIKATRAIVISLALAIFAVWMVINLFGEVIHFEMFGMNRGR